MYFFGIDPDVKESGFAICDNETKEIDRKIIKFFYSDDITKRKIFHSVLLTLCELIKITYVF